MVEASRSINMEDLMAYSDDLVEILKQEKDTAHLMHFVKQCNTLLTQCDKEFNQTRKLIEDYKEKIDECKQKATASQLESDFDGELELLRKEMEEEQKVERRLREELRAIISELDDLDSRRVSIEEQRQSIKKLELGELRAQRKLCMYASVTNIVPYLDDPSRISCHIVDREKKVAKKLELDPSKLSSFDACNHLWKMINLPE